jgi:hypothetical protein
VTAPRRQGLFAQVFLDTMIASDPMRLRSLLIAISSVVLSCVGAVAQSPAPAGQAADEANLIECWWRTDKSTVHVGERFEVTLTCALTETDRLAVEPNVARLEPTTIALSPFEVLDGARQPDLRADAHRYVQFTYTLRLIGDDLFGRDVELPPLGIAYHVRSGSGDSRPQGRERTYELPPLSMRVMSLVPRGVSDIRDASPEAFADIERRRFRARIALVVASICFGLAAILLISAALKASRRFRTGRAAAKPGLSPGAVLRGCLRETGRVRSDVARGGWTPALVGRALTVFRIAGASALSRPITQTALGVAGNGREGELEVRGGLLLRKRTRVSAPTTGQAFDSRARSGNGQRPDAASGPLLDSIGQAIGEFTAARYTTNGPLDIKALDEAFEAGSQALRRLRLAKLWPVRTAALLARSLTSIRRGA